MLGPAFWVDSFAPVARVLIARRPDVHIHTHARARVCARKGGSGPICDDYDVASNGHRMCVYARARARTLARPPARWWNWRRVWRVSAMKSYTH